MIEVHKQRYVPLPPEERKFAKFHKHEQSPEVRAQLEKRINQKVNYGVVDDSKSVNII